ncbi:hypothetical protein [Georgenia subflava]|uniref:Uncharacterized protein n=1 Tax=Georgenia subflava TaxID=1622177 RepID=A0A6N7EIR2_9MICO|nr:hypothetical protein [Georgenia subflava]MPV36973.1 hypothetical protein [Georgenia subflava]
MNEHTDGVENVLLDRLRAADPAARSFTDLHRLREKVDARIAADPDEIDIPPVVAGGTTVPGGTTATVTELDAARDRRRRWMSVAAVAAAAAVVGVAGFDLGRGTAEPAPSAAPPISLGSGVGADGSGGISGAQPFRGSQEAYASDVSMTWPATFGRTTFRGVGLSEDTASIITWAFDPTQSFTAGRAAEAAEVLGVEGEPQLTGGAWQVGPQDGTAPSLTVFSDGFTSLNFYNSSADPFHCMEVLPAPADGDAAVSGPAEGDVGASAEGECRTVDLGPAPVGDAAVEQVRTLLADLGLDAAAYEYEVHADEITPMTSVTAHQLVGSQRTGLTWWVNLTAAGVQSANGPLAPLTELGLQPVVSAQEAVTRLNDPRFGSLGGFTTLAADGIAGPMRGDVAVQGPTDEPPAPPAAGTPVPWPVEEVTIGEARLGLAQHVTPSGAALLVPAYELTSEDGRVWSVIAVAESALDLAPAH